MTHVLMLHEILVGCSHNLKHVIQKKKKEKISECSLYGKVFCESFVCVRVCACTCVYWFKYSPWVVAKVFENCCLGAILVFCNSSHSYFWETVAFVWSVENLSEASGVGNAE